MRGSVPSYQMITPRTLNEALAYLADQPGEWRPFAGGTDLMVQLEAGVLEHRKYLNLSKFDVKTHFELCRH